MFAISFRAYKNKNKKKNTPNNHQFGKQTVSQTAVDSTSLLFTASPSSLYAGYQDM